MTKQTITRRTLVAGAAVAVLPAGGASAAVDPILAAIHAHAVATMQALAACDVASELNHSDPRCPAATAADRAASDRHDQAALALTSVQPTTLEGCIALLHHIDRYNRGMFTLGAGNSTESEQWPVDIEDDDVRKVNGRALRMPFPYWVMRNLQTALEAVAHRA